MARVDHLDQTGAQGSSLMPGSFSAEYSGLKLRDFRVDSNAPIQIANRNASFIKKK